MLLNRPKPDADEPEELLTVDDAAAILGVSTAFLIDTLNRDDEEGDR